MATSSAYPLDNAHGKADTRMDLLARLFDPPTQRALERVGVRSGWHCLEVGGGGGSVARWLAARVGPAGHVLCTDINTRIIENQSAGPANLEVIVHDIANDPGMRGRVIPLAFHVDYWDSLGWRDPFSSSEWTQRQARYARTMRLSSAYTPQAVVNGTREFVGSNRAAMSAALEKASNEKPRADITLTARREGNSLIAHIHANVPATDDVMLAIVEDGVTTKIEHGENAGRTLTNDAIVRKLVQVRSGESTVRLDPAWRSLSATAFVQDRITFAIGGVATTQVK